MKVFFKSLCAGFIVAILLTLVPFEGECREISDRVFRVHILANSDSESDQALKLKVRDAVIAKGEELFADVHSKEQAEQIVCDNIDVLVKTAEDVVSAEGYSYPVTASVKNIYFNTRYYEDVTMPGGFYDALQIRIGNAEGQNWWCVMYPSLCIYSASDNDTLDEQLTSSQYSIVSSKGEFQFRLKFVEIFNRFIDLISEN